MRWMTLFLVLFSQNHLPEAREIFNATHDPIQPSTPAAVPPDSKPVQKLETAEDSNTWYPLPKWKVFLQADKKHNGHSAPRFGSRISRRADGNTSSYANGKARPEKIVEKLNIRLLAPKEGGVTSFERLFNGSGEYFAVFAVLARGLQSRKNDSDHRVRENLYLQSSVTGITTTRRIVLDHEVVTVPLTENITIELRPRSHHSQQNYTVMVLPTLNDTDRVLIMEKNGNEIIKIPMSQNKWTIHKSEERMVNYEELLPTTDDATDSLPDMAQIEGTESVPVTEQTVTATIDRVIGTSVTHNTHDTEKTGGYGTAVKESSSQTEEYVQNQNIMTSSESPDNFLTKDHADEMTMKQDLVQNHGKNTFSEIRNKNSTFPEETSTTTERTNRTPKLSDDSNANTYFVKFGPYEVQNLNDSQQPLTAVIYITLKSNGTKVSLQDNKSVASRKQNSRPSNVNPMNINFERLNKRSRRYVYSNFITNQQPGSSKRSYRKKNNESSASRNQNSNINPMNINLKKSNKRAVRCVDRNCLIHQQPSSSKRSSRKQIIRNENISNLRAAASQYSGKESKLNPIQGAPVLNYDSAILASENIGRTRNPSNLFPSRQENDSYSTEAITRSNEDFNQTAMREFGNRGLIINEMSRDAGVVDGTESNQTASGDSSAREAVVVPLLIPKKWSPRENDSKKSELQMVGQSSVLKILPRGGYLGKTDIKTGEMCDLMEDGCLEVNDVSFPRRGKLGEEGEEASIKKKENGGGIRMKWRRSLLQFLDRESDTDVPFQTSSLTSRDENPTEHQHNIYPEKPSKELNSHTKLSYPNDLSSNAKNTSLGSLQLLLMMRTQDKLMKQLKYGSAHSKKSSRQLIDSKRSSSSSSVLQRTKRSWSNIPLVLNPNCVVYLIKINEYPHRQFPHHQPMREINQPMRETHHPIREIPTFSPNRNVQDKNQGPHHVSNLGPNRVFQPGTNKPLDEDKDLIRPETEFPIVIRGGHQTVRATTPSHDRMRLVPPGNQPNINIDPSHTRKPLTPGHEREDDAWEDDWVLVNPETTYNEETLRKIPFPPSSKTPVVVSKYPRKTTQTSWGTKGQRQPDSWTPSNYQWQIVKPPPLMPGTLGGGD